MRKKWKTKTKRDLRFKTGDLRIKEIIKILLENRNLKTKKQIEDFFDPPEPSSHAVRKQLGVSKRELSKAVKRIKKAIKNKESIVIYGDYDADGICATAVLWETLYSLGAKVLPFIPHREEHGYGLSRKGIDEILNNKTIEQYNNRGISLIITVDNGIVAHKAVDYAKKKGIDVIITDHHQKKLKIKNSRSKNKYDLSKAVKTPRGRPLRLRSGQAGLPRDGGIKYDLPAAEAIVWTDKLSGAGVAWVLAKELVEKFPKGQSLLFARTVLKKEKLIKGNLDLVAIGTIADLMPLLGTNRLFVKYGLKQLNKTERVGLNALFEESGFKKGEIDTWQVGFIIAPRLNAMGRLESALTSLRLLCTRDKNRAKKLAATLSSTNRERQELTLSTFEHARKSVKLKAKSEKVLFISHESYNQGIIGLVAGKLVEKFYRPAIVISQGEIYSKASVRSVSGFNIIQCLRTFEDFFEDLGGHPMAAGFTVKTEKLPILKQKLEELVASKLDGELLRPVIEADCEISLSDISRQLFEKLSKFAPFGIGNPQPTFVTRGVEVVSFRQVGKERNHLKLRLTDYKDSPCREQGLSLKEKYLDAIAFGQGDLALKLSPGKKINICYTIEEDNWHNNRRLQLKIKDISFC